MQEVVIYRPGEKAIFDLIEFLFMYPKESLIVFVILVGFMWALNKFISSYKR